MIEEIRELFQNFIAPQLEGLKGDIRALDAKFEAKIDTLDAKLDSLDGKFLAKLETVVTKVESFRRELLAEIRRGQEVLSTDFVRLEEKVDLRLANVDTKLVAMNEKLAGMNEKLDFHRRELLAEIKAALK
jgi:hypothetical protein